MKIHSEELPAKARGMFRPMKLYTNVSTEWADRAILFGSGRILAGKYVNHAAGIGFCTEITAKTEIHRMYDLRASVFQIRIIYC